MCGFIRFWECILSVPGTLEIAELNMYIGVMSEIRWYLQRTRIYMLNDNKYMKYNGFFMFKLLK